MTDESTQKTDNSNPYEFDYDKLLHGMKEGNKELEVENKLRVIQERSRNRISRRKSSKREVGGRRKVVVRENYLWLFDKIMEGKGIKGMGNEWFDRVLVIGGRVVFVKVVQTGERVGGGVEEVREWLRSLGAEYYVYRGEWEVIGKIEKGE
jgi:hypothetical protein